MSLLFENIHCNGCEFEGIIQYRPITLRYQISDGESVDSHRVLGWCFNCEGIRDIEAELDVNLLRSEIKNVQLLHSSIGERLKVFINRL